MKGNNAFTLESQGGYLSALITKCGIFPAFDPRTQPTDIKGQGYDGLWDTGASGTVITKRVVDELGLKQTGLRRVNHANGSSTVPTYAINIKLPNDVEFCFIEVCEGILSGFDVLIGMDIITKGDFAITNTNGRTTFSFRCPSIEKFDFVDANNLEMDKNKKVKEVIKTQKVGRNDLCPCGSGAKYKKCHGRNAK